MQPTDRQIDSSGVVSDQTETHLALFNDGYPASCDKRVLKVNTESNCESVLNFSPIAALSKDAAELGDDVKTIVERKDKQKLEVTRSKSGELLAIVFMDFNPASSLRKEKGCWVSNPPLHPDTKIEDVEVDAQGTITLTVTHKGEKGKWVHHSDGKEDWPFRK